MVQAQTIDAWRRAVTIRSLSGSTMTSHNWFSTCSNGFNFSILSWHINIHLKLVTSTLFLCLDVPLTITLFYTLPVGPTSGWFKEWFIARTIFCNLHTHTKKKTFYSLNTSQCGSSVFYSLNRSQCIMN